MLGNFTGALPTARLPSRSISVPNTMLPMRARASVRPNPPGWLAYSPIRYAVRISSWLVDRNASSPSRSLSRSACSRCLCVDGACLQDAIGKAAEAKRETLRQRERGAEGRLKLSDVDDVRGALHADGGAAVVKLARVTAGAGKANDVHRLPRLRRGDHRYRGAGQSDGQPAVIVGIRRLDCGTRVGLAVHGPEAGAGVADRRHIRAGNRSEPGRLARGTARRSRRT